MECLDEEGGANASPSSCLLPNFDFVLAPVAFYEDPTAAVMDPVMRNPARSWMRWTVPAAGNPDVALTVPAVVPVNPYESALWQRGTAFDDGGRWSDANNDLCKGSCRSQTKGKK